MISEKMRNDALCFSHKWKCTFAVQSINCRGKRLQIKIMLALVSLLIFTRKEHKLKFSCRKFIIFQVQRIFTELQNYCFTRREFESINLLADVLIKESFKTVTYFFHVWHSVPALDISRGSSRRHKLVSLKVKGWTTELASCWWHWINLTAE